MLDLSSRPSRSSDADLEQGRQYAPGAGGGVFWGLAFGPVMSWKTLVSPCPTWFKIASSPT